MRATLNNTVKRGADAPTRLRGRASSEEYVISEHIEIPSARTTQAVVPLSDSSTPDERARDRYLGVLHDLVEDAAEGQRLHLLGDVIAWTFARLAIGCGPAATADLLAKVGKYMGALEEQKEAKRELERAREEGRLAH